MTVTFGERLASIRKRRGLTQRELAQESGVSVQLIRSLEQGAREDTRLETARKLAVALRVPTTELIVRHDSDAPTSGDVEDWTPVRRALEGRYDGAVPPELPTMAGVAAALEAYKPLLRGADFGELQRALPGLLRDADWLVREAAGDKSEVRRLRSRVRQMTAWLMTLTWQFDTADLAIRLALDDAPDTQAAVPVIDCQCWSYIRQGDLAKAREYAIRWADEIEPHKISKASRGDLASWGLMLLRVSTAAVRDNRPGEASDALKFAHMAAMGITRSEYDSNTNFVHTFGPTTVAMLAAENAMVEDKPDVTLTVAAKLDGRGFPLPWTWNRHRLDVAHAHVALRQRGEALDVLKEIRGDLPEWLVKQRYARDIMGKIIEKRRTLTPEIRELADFVKVPY